MWVKTDGGRFEVDFDKTLALALLCLLVPDIVADALVTAALVIARVRWLMPTAEARSRGSGPNFPNWSIARRPSTAASPNKG